MAKRSKRFQHRQKHRRKSKRATDKAAASAKVMEMLEAAALREGEGTAKAARALIAARHAQFRHIFKWPDVPTTSTLAANFDRETGSRLSRLVVTPAYGQKGFFKLVADEMTENQEDWGYKVGAGPLVTNQHLWIRPDGGIEGDAFGLEALLLMLVEFSIDSEEDGDWEVRLDSTPFQLAQNIMADLGYAWDIDPMFQLIVAGAS